MKLIPPKALLPTLLTFSMFSPAILADDTDIFVTDNQSTGGNTAFQPNVLFVFDTSGSMGNNITVTEDYDPSKSYGSSDPSKIYVYTTNFNTFMGTLTDTQNNCKTMKDRIASNPADPTWYGDAAYWRNSNRANRSRWRSICFSGDNCRFTTSKIVDCAADQSIHGENSSSSAVYTVNGSNGPYQTTSGGAFDWSGVSDRYYVSANYHDYLQDGPSSSRRKIDIMKEEAKDLVDNFNGLNLGMMRFNGSEGGYSVHHFSDISLASEKTTMKNVIDGLPASGNTPLAETLWEAGLYYRGDNIFYGSNSIAAAVSAGKYNSPMENSCQKNHIIFLTDGQPYSDNGRDSAIRSLTGSSCSHSDGTSNSSNTCLDELAQYLFSNDQNSDLTGTQVIETYTIGFDIDMNLLEQTAVKGGGKYFTAGNSTELKSAFTQIIEEILDTNTTFTAPAVSVNAYNNLQHRDELYYAMFKPESKVSWPGNIKRYKITSEGVLVDVNGDDAVDPNTGFFIGGARSWWSAAPDGDQVKLGGLAEQLQSERKAYVYTGSSSPTNIALNTSEHILSTSNTAITNELMNLDPSTTDDERNNLIKWALGEDVDGVDPDDNTHNFVADPLHTRPAVVTYGGSESSPDDTVYAMTNMGYLHAIDTDNGAELFTFIPQELLPNLESYYENPVGAGKAYGLDGHLTVWREESNDADFDIEAADGDKVYLYLGMRRGGTNYYALDVTDRSNPVLKWRIEGGVGAFSNLGQSWSQPQLRTLKWQCDSFGNNCTSTQVLIFAGGYDTIHDTTDVPTTGDTGSSIFMVNAETGSLIWSAGPDATNTMTLPQMTNSIPSNAISGDTDGDGGIDVIFATDIMGHIWRFDINSEANTVSELTTAGMIADLSGSGGADLKRFFNSVDVAAFAPRGEEAFFTLSVGSGFRADPKEEVIADKFYSLFLPSVFKAPTDEDGNITYTTLTENDLFNATNAVADRDDNAPNGFYIDMARTGEKVLSESITFAGTAFFTSYVPNGNPNTCGVDIGAGYLYALDVLTGEGKFDEDRDIPLKHGGIAAPPVIIYTKDESGGDGSSKTKPVLCVGTECMEPPEEAQLLNKTYWREEH